MANASHRVTGHRRGNDPSTGHRSSVVLAIDTSAVEGSRRLKLRSSTAYTENMQQPAVASLVPIIVLSGHVAVVNHLRCSIFVIGSKLADHAHGSVVSRNVCSIASKRWSWTYMKLAGCVFAVKRPSICSSS